LWPALGCGTQRMAQFSEEEYKLGQVKGSTG